MSIRAQFAFASLALAIAAFALRAEDVRPSPAPSAAVSAAPASGSLAKIVKTEEQWKAELPEAAYHVLREKGTERPFTGAYVDDHTEGTFQCAACGLDLFDSKTKFNSGTGWPSFYDVTSKANVKVNRDESSWMVREEVVCARCDGHMGHVFSDGPAPTGLRYCINSVSIKLKKR